MPWNALTGNVTVMGNVMDGWRWYLVLVLADLGVLRRRGSLFNISDTLRQTIYNPIMWRSLDAELFPSTYLGCDEECWNGLVAKCLSIFIFSSCLHPRRPACSQLAAQTGVFSSPFRQASLPLLLTFCIISLPTIILVSSHSLCLILLPQICVPALH